MSEWTFPRRAGKAIVEKVILEAALRRGEHVHRVSRSGGTTCEGGDSECPLYGIQLVEAMEAWS